MDKTRVDLLESKGPETVLLEIAAGHHGQKGSQLQDETEAWLRSKQIMADKEASSKRDAREEETLSIAREANDIARLSFRAVRKDRYIAITAVIIAAIAAKEEIGAFIRWVLDTVKP